MFQSQRRRARISTALVVIAQVAASACSRNEASPPAVPEPPATVHPELWPRADRPRIDDAASKRDSTFC